LAFGGANSQGLGVGDPRSALTACGPHRLRTGHTRPQTIAKIQDEVLFHSRASQLEEDGSGHAQRLFLFCSVQACDEYFRRRNSPSPHAAKRLTLADHQSVIAVSSGLTTPRNVLPAPIRKFLLLFPLKSP